MLLYLFCFVVSVPQTCCILYLTVITATKSVVISAVRCFEYIISKTVGLVINWNIGQH